jgi:accessory gene regulator protein AgrB
MTETILENESNADSQQVKSLGLKFGIIAGLIELALMYGSYYGGMDSFLSVKVVSRFIPYTFLLFLFGAHSLRKKRGNYLTLKEGLQFAFLAYIVAEIMSAAGTYILYNMIDPELTRKSLTLGAERTRIMLEKLNTPKSEIDQEIAKIRAGNETTGLKQIVMGMGYELIFDFMKSMIIAFLIKRERKITV